jgi:hypothetical protein
MQFSLILSIRIYVCICVCMCVYVCVYAMCASVRMWVYNTVYMCTVCVYVYIYIHVCIYLCIYYMYVYNYVCVCKKKVLSLLCQYIISVFWSIYLHVYSIQPWKTSRCFLNMWCATLHLELSLFCCDGASRRSHLWRDSAQKSHGWSSLTHSNCK